MSEEITKKDKIFQNWIVFTIYAESLSLAMHLKKEGKNVIFAQVDDLKTIGITDLEDSETKKKRLSPGDGLVDKVKAEDYIKKMGTFENKDDYFVLFDFSSLYPYAEKAVKAGFTHGIFPTKLDHKLENDRQFAKEFVQSYYPDLKVAECFEFKTIEEGIEMLEKDEENFYALKGNHVSCQTVVPTTKDHQFATTELIEALNAHKEDYTKSGFILERQIRDGVEFCPQSVWYEGIPHYTVDVECKAIGAGDLSIKCGCLFNVIISIPDDAPIVKKAFPEIVGKLANKHTGLYYMDANLIMKDGELYWLEYCVRLGYDAIQAECEMAGGVSKYFEALCNGKNPYERKYGVSVRGLNMHRDHEGNVKGGLAIRWKAESEDHIWFYDLHKDKETGKYTNGGYEYELLVVFGGSSDDIEWAIIKAYQTIDDFSFPELYYRNYDDFICREYDNNILNRVDAIESIISSPEVADE